MSNFITNFISFFFPTMLFVIIISIVIYIFFHAVIFIVDPDDFPQFGPRWLVRILGFLLMTSLLCTLITLEQTYKKPPQAEISNK